MCFFRFFFSLKLWYNRVMLRFVIEKFNNVIQWSKKYHFFHILAIPSFFYIVNWFWLAYIFNILFNNTSNLQKAIEDPSFLIFFLTFLFAVAFIIQVIIYVKNKKKGIIQVSYPFFLNNKIYNFFYIHTYISLFIIILTIISLYL